MDHHVELLVSASEDLKADYPVDISQWEGSPFEWIISRPARQRGKIGEQLVSRWCRAMGFRVERSPDQEADRIVEGRRTEIKFSSRWKSGKYTFQQLRDQDYEIVICLGLSPFDAHCWVLTKDTVMQKWRAEDAVRTQHGGRTGSDTAWFKVDPLNAPTWLRSRGGSLSAAFKVLQRLLES